MEIWVIIMTIIEEKIMALTKLISHGANLFSCSTNTAGLLNKNKEFSLFTTTVPSDGTKLFNFKLSFTNSYAIKVVINYF